MNRILSIGLAVLVVAVVVASSSVFIVRQTSQVLITQLGNPVRVITQPGLHFKIPFIQTVTTFDTRLLAFETASSEVILGDQRRVIVDMFTRFRIVDPLKFYQTVGANELGIRARLSAIVPSAARRVLGSKTLQAMLSADRQQIMSTIRDQVNGEAASFGIRVEDVRIRRADLPEANTQAILQRMQTERQRLAREARAEGDEIAQRIRANADRERTVIVAEANAQADILRGEGEQESITTVAAAFQRDPAFFTAWRTLQAYRTAFGEGGAQLVLTPDSDFMRLFRAMPGVSGPGTAPAAAGGR